MKLLPKNQYIDLLPQLATVEINHYFAKSVLNGTIEGTVYVDNIFTDDVTTPKSIYIVSKYGMSLLFGRHDNQEFNQQLKKYLLNETGERDHDEWLQVFPNCWGEVVEILCQKKLLTDTAVNLLEQPQSHAGYFVRNTRVNFTFNAQQYRKLTKSENNHSTTMLDEHIFEQLDGSVVPKQFWESAKSFVQQGKGFCLTDNNIIVSTSFSACIDEKVIEIGIETNEQYRGKGYAVQICQTLIDYCLENHILPVWACRHENQGSYRLAKKLGFVPSNYLPYYRLCKND